uniref:Tachykinin-related peptide 3 n=5 Tax=Pentatominae TaxID=286710 RepID=TRP3_NEZVI|nr:RecName: Full=Tachykinin-related peptide 3; Short=TKRP-3 [Acrosternum hilare]P86565.1 RecName: Full=Tachykinin-related peptide 3; Short=TKRP-3 [Banasa dimiata]P86571.1 RecName: Full=Tachykinin-related peptide 3; Short=TKRP-3 [Euschistus servus]P86577.1 RecName: Full=Tachykinin-related peptide 3; Short=TKRP-3 [Nezara viridula]P86589.1 RecName: Full=Tachykinin-related peptide 3; Short=TKRP-3 [Pentatoma rufipes]
GPSSGFFGMR